MTKATSTTAMHRKKSASVAPEVPRTLRVGRELADTTWRMALPVVLFACLGIIADKRLDSKPWLTLLGVVIGFMCAAVLIKRQLDRWPVQPVKPGSYERNRRPGDDEDKDYYSD